MDSSGDKKNLHDLLRTHGYEDEDAPHIADNLAETSKEVRKRVCALKKIQMESVKIEAKFYERVHLLEKEFQPLFDEINKRVSFSVFLLKTFYSALQLLRVLTSLPKTNAICH